MVRTLELTAKSEFESGYLKCRKTIWLFANRLMTNNNPVISYRFMILQFAVVESLCLKTSIFIPHLDVHANLKFVNILYFLSVQRMPRETHAF